MRRVLTAPLVALITCCVGHGDEPARPDEIARLVADLGDRDYTTREKATKALAAKGWDAVDRLDKELATLSNPEAADRLRRVIAGITRLDWHTAPAAAVAAAKKAGKPVLTFSTIGGADGFS